MTLVEVLTQRHLFVSPEAEIRSAIPGMRFRSRFSTSRATRCSTNPSAAGTTRKSPRLESHGRLRRGCGSPIHFALGCSPLLRARRSRGETANVRLRIIRTRTQSSRLCFLPRNQTNSAASQLRCPLACAILVVVAMIALPKILSHRPGVFLLRFNGCPRNLPSAKTLGPGPRIAIRPDPKTAAPNSLESPALTKKTG